MMGREGFQRYLSIVDRTREGPKEEGEWGQRLETQEVLGKGQHNKIRQKDVSCRLRPFHLQYEVLL